MKWGMTIEGRIFQDTLNYCNFVLCNITGLTILAGAMQRQNIEPRLPGNYQQYGYISFNIGSNLSVI